MNIRRYPYKRHKLWLLPLAAALTMSSALAQDEDACVLPGVLITEDAAGDDQSAPAGLGFGDILSIHGAELADSNTLTFSFKVASLAIPPPHIAWIVRFATETAPDNGDDDYFVAMVTLSDGFIRYVYGTNGFAAGAPGEPRQFRVLGELDGSSYSEDGTITLVLDKSAVPSLEPGKEVFNILPTVRVVTPAEDGTPFFTNGANQTILDDAPAGFYSVAGNDCGASKSGLLGVGAFGLPALFALLGFAVIGFRRR